MRYFKFLAFLVVFSLGAEVPSLRHHAIIGTSQGFLPEKVSLLEGEKLKIFFTSLSRKGGTCFVLSSHDIFLSPERGKVAVAEVLFEKPGDYLYHCPDRGKKEGTITVLPKRSEKERQKREPSSVDEWMPREY